MSSCRGLLVIAVVTASLAVAGSARAAIVSFQSPSKNIGCVLFSQHARWSVRCDVAQHSWPTPKRPRSCRLDYGNGVQLFNGRAHYVCAGDTALGQGPVLAYGHSIARGVLRCTSTEAGVSCVNTRHHHGFSVSRETVHLY